MDNQQVKEHFKKQADDYVGLMIRLVPHYLEQQRIMMKLIRFTPDDHFRVLDLGSGPGVFAELILDRFPNSEVVAFDLTEEMLAVCQQRLSRHQDRLQIRQGDFKTHPIGHGYDLVIAGLTLHHLKDHERRDVFRTIYSALNDRGLFLAREVVVDESQSVTEQHYRIWRDYMKSQGEDDLFWYQRHLEKDHPVTINDELLWLGDAGFSNPACHWRYFNFAIISAEKVPT